MKNIFTKSSMYDPLNNYLFFKIFGEKGDEIQLLGFINAVLGRTGENRFTSVEILENTSFMADIMGGKSCILDVRAQLPDSAYVNIEVQLKNKHDFDRRSLYYSSREYTSRMESGDDYKSLQNVIAINIVDFNFPDTENFHSCFHLREDTEHEIILTDALEVHYINMVKYRKQRKNHSLNEPLFRWLAWFDINDPNEVREEAMEMDAAIQTAEERFKFITQNKDEIDAYYRYLMAEWDRKSELKYALDEEAKKCKTEIASNLLVDGLSPERVSKNTGLSLEEIAKL